MTIAISTPFADYYGMHRAAHTTLLSRLRNWWHGLTETVEDHPGATKDSPTIEAAAIVTDPLSDAWVVFEPDMAPAVIGDQLADESPVTLDWAPAWLSATTWLATIEIKPAEQHATDDAEQMALTGGNV